MELVFLLQPANSPVLTLQHLADAIIIIFTHNQATYQTVPVVEQLQVQLRAFPNTSPLAIYSSSERLTKREVFSYQW